VAGGKEAYRGLRPRRLGAAGFNLARDSQH